MLARQTALLNSKQVTALCYLLSFSAAPRETNNQQKPFDITGSANHIALNSVLITIMSILAVIFIMTHRL